MRTTKTQSGEFVTTVTKADLAKFRRIVERLGHEAVIEPLGGYAKKDLWPRIVSQVCVMGSSKGMAALRKDKENGAAFDRAMSLKQLSKKSYRVNSIAKVLRDYGATRFPQEAAKKLKLVIGSESVKGTKCVVATGLSHKHNHEEVRDALMERCPVFKLKSASDFMITAGLSRNVIAIDVRVAGILQEHFGYNLSASKIQASRARYESVENALREVCDGLGTNLGILDRCLFQFSGMSVLDFTLGRRGW